MPLVTARSRAEDRPGERMTPSRIPSRSPRPGRATDEGGANRERAHSPPSTAREILKRILVGRPMASHRFEHTLLSKFLALPVFSADAISSVAYSVEASMTVLLVAGLAAFSLVLPIQIGIAALMIVVVTSYRQTVHAYPSGGGSYIVSKDNLGTNAGLVAAAALLTDYVLTVAVSVSSGVLAIVSAFPALLPYRIELSLFFVAFIALANLRGVRESGWLFALPTYGFIASAGLLIVVGLIKSAVHGLPPARVPSPIPAGAAMLSLSLVLHAFSSGASALTGVEAISNGIRAFKRPQSRNAATTLGMLGAIGATLVISFAFLAMKTHARPSTDVSVLSEIARSVFPGVSGSGSAMFYVVQVFTFAILILAANTSFQDFPRLSSILAHDRFMPRQFENLGDRLVFSNGVIGLAVLASLLIWAFQADVDRLIQLYVVGVFTAFTLSQTGMVRHWLRVARQGGPGAAGWRHRAFINGIGAFATGIVTLVVVRTKFGHGAWIVIVAIPVIVLGFRAVHRHYEQVARLLACHPARVDPLPANQVLLWVDSLDAATSEAVSYVRSFCGDQFRPVHVHRRTDPPDLDARWTVFSRSKARLEIVQPLHGPVEAFVSLVRSLQRGPDDFVTVVIPELFPKRSVATALRQSPAFSLKLQLLSEPGVVVADVPVLAEANGDGRVRRPPLIPNRVEAIVFISAVDAVSIRAVRYALSLKAQDVRAVFVATDGAAVGEVLDAWSATQIPVQLDVVEAPFRDLRTPILNEVRHVTARPGAIVAAVLPELLVSKRRHLLLHNQRGLFIKHLLLFEPRVVLSSVPTRMDQLSLPLLAPARPGR